MKSNKVRTTLFWKNLHQVRFGEDVSVMSFLGLSCLVPLVFLFPKSFIYLAFKFFDNESTWYFKHILLFNNKLLDRTQVSQLRNIFTKTYLMKIIPEKRSAHFIWFHQYGVGSRPALWITKRVLAAASAKVYQLLAHGRWFSPGTPKKNPY
jgi:hypothetical protein